MGSSGHGPVGAGLRLVATERRTFAGPARYLDDPANRAALATYLADLPGAGSAPRDGQSYGGQSYGEMAEELIAAVVPAGAPVDLLVLAYSIHDVQPGRATATYLSSVCPGTPLSFAICDQGSAAAFTGLRIAQDYQADPAGTGRVLLIVLEQAALPYPVAAPRPARHRGVALLFEREVVAGAAGPRLVGLRQRPGLAAAEVAQQAAADLAELSADYRQVRVLANPALAGAWPEQPADLGPADQPATGLCWRLLDELADGQPDLVVAADYDPDLGYLCLAAFEPR